MNTRETIFDKKFLFLIFFVLAVTSVFFLSPKISIAASTGVIDGGDIWVSDATSGPCKGAGLLKCGDYTYRYNPGFYPTGTFCSVGWSQEAYSANCGYVDPCVGVSCSRGCYGTRFCESAICISKKNGFSVDSGACYGTNCRNSTGCGYVDPCTNNTCPTYYCVGTTYYPGYCSSDSGVAVCKATTGWGIRVKAPECGYVAPPPPPPDPCADISCNDYCSETSLNTNGYCSNGLCNYSTVPNSESCGYVPPPIVPSAPTNFSATLDTTNASDCGGAKINLSWSSSPTATSYTVKRNGSIIYTGATTSAVDTDLTFSTNYSYTLTASNSGGASSSVSTSGVCNLTVSSISVVSNIPTSWTISPGNITGSGTNWRQGVNSNGGTTYTISPANIPGYFTPTISNNITGNSSSLSLFGGDSGNYTLTYTMTQEQKDLLSSAMKVSLDAFPTVVAQNQKFRLFWSNENVTNCNASGGPWSGEWEDSKALEDSKENIGPITGDTEFKLKCINSQGGEKEDNVLVTVVPPDFSLQKSNNVELAGVRGTSTPAILIVLPENSFSSPVHLSVSYLPPQLSGAKISLSKGSLPSSGYSSGTELRITTNNPIATGSYLITIQGESGGLVRTINVILNVDNKKIKIEEF